ILNEVVDRNVDLFSGFVGAVGDLLADTVDQILADVGQFGQFAQQAGVLRQFDAVTASAGGWLGPDAGASGAAGGPQGCGSCRSDWANVVHHSNSSGTSLGPRQPGGSG